MGVRTEPSRARSCRRKPLAAARYEPDRLYASITACPSLPEQVAYDVCGALAAREAEIPWEAGTDGCALQMGHEGDSTPMDVPLHPGAKRWYREHGHEG